MARVLVSVFTGVGRLGATLGVKAGHGLGRLLLRMAKILGLTVLAAVVIFLLDLVLVRDEGRPAD